MRMPLVDGVRAAATNCSSAVWPEAESVASPPANEVLPN
jgi:hypothetical protein